MSVYPLTWELRAWSQHPALEWYEEYGEWLHILLYHCCDGWHDSKYVAKQLHSHLPFHQVAVKRHLRAQPAWYWKEPRWRSEAWEWRKSEIEHAMIRPKTNLSLLMGSFLPKWRRRGFFSMVSTLSSTPASRRRRHIRRWWRFLDSWSKVAAQWRDILVIGFFHRYNCHDSSDKIGYYNTEIGLQLQSIRQQMLREG